MDGHGCGNAAGEHRVPDFGERVPALRARSVVPQEMAPKCPGGRSDHHPVCGRCCGRVPTQAGCGAIPPRRSGEAGSLRSSASTRTRPASSSSDGSRLRTVAGAGRAGRKHSTSWASRISARRPGEAASGLVANRSRKGSTEPWRASTRFFANAGITTSGRSASGLDGSVQGWLNYFAVPGSSRFLRAFRRRLQRLWMRALRRRSQRHRLDWKRLERMTEILWPRVSIRHPWPDQRFAVKHPR